MDWQDEGVVLDARRHGEHDAVLSLFTFEHGRHLGLVRGGAGRRARPLLQRGNRLSCRWRARLSDHLGSYTVEPLRLFAATVMDDALLLTALDSACGLLDAGLGERDAHPGLYAPLLTLLEKLAARAGDWPQSYVRFELLLLGELGFGLDLERCAVTGTTENLAYVSPRTGRAVSREAAGEWVPRLLPLPAFLRGGEEADDAEIAQGLRLAAHFIRRHILAPAERPLPAARERLADLWQQRMEKKGKA